MSDGLSDARRLEEQAVAVREAAFALKDALEACDGGVRGWTNNASEVLAEVNVILGDAGYVLRRK